MKKKGGRLAAETKALGAARREKLRRAGLLGKPVQRAWTQQNGRALASKRACRTYRTEDE